MFQEKQISANNLDICYKLWTGKTNKTIVCLHGWLDNASSFDLLAPYLSDYTLIALDLPGHGKSAHLPDANFYHFIDGISHLHAITKALKLDSYCLLGHSLGACISSMAAGVLRSDITSLILLDAIGPLTNPPTDSAIHYETYLKRLPVILKKQKRYYESIDEATRTRAQKGYLSEDLTRVITERGLKKSEKGYYWSHDDRLLLPSPLRMTEAQILPFLAKISAPTLLITAKQGFQYDEDKALKRINAVRDMTHITLEGGHHIHLEAPKACAETITTFLQDKDPI